MFSFQTVLSRQIPAIFGAPRPAPSPDGASNTHPNNANNATALQTQNVPFQDPVHRSR